MSKTLAAGYALCIATLGAMILLSRGAIVQRDGPSVFFYSNLVGVLMLVSAFLCFRGARSCRSRTRKVLASLVSLLSLLIGVGSAVAVTLVALGLAKTA
ncbi:hypothetical protein [Dokdonella ginsengisoli]|uniref:Uncharacterized protein n=1 Tax=Dokdonella ginsengisoli TaxID=363846 RepID=A0ABV9QV39_9GAMM